jgi:hypothetical protein
MEMVERTRKKSKEAEGGRKESKIDGLLMGGIGRMVGGAEAGRGEEEEEKEDEDEDGG